MYSQEEINNLIVRLKDYYPNRANEAIDILTHEYELSAPLIGAIMHLVRTIAEKNNCFMWPVYNVVMQPFYVN